MCKTSCSMSQNCNKNTVAVNAKIFRIPTENGEVRMEFTKQKKGSFVSALFGSRPDCIFLVKGKDTTNRPAWYYVMVDKSKKDTFEHIEGKQSLNLNDYGTILHSGYGDEPPPEMKKKMEDEYGFKEA